MQEQWGAKSFDEFPKILEMHLFVIRRSWKRVFTAYFGKANAFLSGHGTIRQSGPFLFAEPNEKASFSERKPLFFSTKLEKISTQKERFEIGRYDEGRGFGMQGGPCIPECFHSGFISYQFPRTGVSLGPP
jgi:hypothetical protein